MVQVTKETVIWIGLVVAIAGGAGALIAGGVLGDLAGEGSAETVFIEGSAKQGLPGQVVAEATIQNTGREDIRVLLVALDGLTGNEILFVAHNSTGTFEPTEFNGVARTYNERGQAATDLDGATNALDFLGTDGQTISSGRSNQFSGVLDENLGVAPGGGYTLTAVYVVDGSTELVFVTETIRIGI